MGTIYISELKLGMVLAQDIVDHQGSLVLKAETAITKKNLKILKMWGITEVNVVDVERDDVLAESKSKMDPAILEKVENKARQLFHRANIDHPVMRELMNQYIIRNVRALSEKEESNAPT